MAKKSTEKSSAWASPKEIIAEMMGTFGLAFAVLASSKAAAGASLVGNYNSLEKVLETSQQIGQDPATGTIVTAMTYIVATGVVAAFTLAMFVLTIGKVSGCNINPAVTFGLWSSGNMKTHKAISYILAQFAGAFGAFALLSVFISGQVFSGFTASGDWKVMVAEALGMLIFSFGIANVVINKKEGVEAALTIGGSLFLGIVFAGVVAGAGVLNPAVALSVKSLTWSHVVGPMVGAVAGTFVAFFLNGKAKEFTLFGLRK